MSKKSKESIAIIFLIITTVSIVVATKKEMRRRYDSNLDCGMSSKEAIAEVVAWH